MRLKDKVAVITGASSGIGRGIAKRFAQEGANVVIADIQLDAAEKIVDEIEEIDQKALALKIDVSNPEDVDEMVSKTIEEFGKIDILVDNAGVFVQKPITEMEEEDWDKVLNVNLRGAFLCTRRTVREMIRNGGGKIVNIASVAGEVGFENSSAYCASKGGIITLTKELALELAPKGINVNAIGPRVIETPMTKSLLKDEKFKNQVLGMTPIGRLGKPKDIAAAAVYLASDEADFVSGEILFVDGGWLTS